MDLATVVGGVVGVLLVLVVMLLSGSLLMYWDMMSLIVVLGGAAASCMMRWPLPVFLGAVQVTMNAFLNKLTPPETLIDKITELADVARKNSVLGLEKVQIEDPFLEKGIKLAVDGNEPEIIKEMLNDEIEVLEQRLKDGRGIIDDMAKACPAFGMIGTVIGLIVIMANLSNPDKIGPGLAVALVTTLYGAMLSNMFFIPVGKKLKFRGAEEVRNAQMIRLGVVAILHGENPRLIRERAGDFCLEKRPSD